MRVFLIRGLVAIAWAVVFAAVSDSLTTGVTVGAGVLLVLYPLIDAVASLIDARTQRRVRHRRHRLRPGCDRRRLPEPEHARDLCGHRRDGVRHPGRAARASQSPPWPPCRPSPARKLTIDSTDSQPFQRAPTRITGPAHHAGRAVHLSFLRAQAQ